MKPEPITETSSNQKQPLFARKADGRTAPSPSIDNMTLQIVHDLKDPLFGLSYLAELLISGEIDPDEQAEFGQAIQKTVRKMKRLVDQILQGTHEKQELLRVQDVNPGRVLDDVLKGFSLQIREKQATIDQPAIFPHVMANEAWMYMIFRNLISNALKYGGNPLHLRIHFDYALHGYIRFWFEDNGPGIPAAEIPHLFSPFYRSVQAREEGHGLGLSFVKKMVERMGGKVGVISPEGQGARFYFSLPAH